MRNFAYFLLAVLGLWVAHLSQEINSDHYTLATFLMDLLEDPLSIKGWVFQAAHYFFPEIPFVLPFQAIGVPFAGSVFLFMLMIAGVHAWSFYRLERALGSEPEPLAAFSVLWFSLLGLLVYSIQQWKTSVPIYDLYFHSGQAAVGFLVVILFLFEDPTKFPRRWQALGFLILSLILLSDPLFLVQFEMPVLAVLLFRGWQSKDWKINLRLGGFLISANILSHFFSWAIEKWNLVETLHIPFLQLAPPLTVWKMLKDIFQSITGSHEIIFLLIMALVGLFQILRRSSPGERSRWVYFIVWGLLSLLGTVLAVALKGLWFEFSEMRYLTNWILYPWFVIGTWILRTTSEKKATIGLASVVFITAMFGFFKSSPADQGPPPGLECLLKAQADFSLHTGLTSYWDAKKLRYFSGGRLSTIQVVNGFEVFEMAANRYWLQPPGLGKPMVDYVLLNRAHPTYINSEDSLKKFGAPEKILECGDFQLLIYRPLSLNF